MRINAADASAARANADCRKSTACPRVGKAPPLSVSENFRMHVGGTAESTDESGKRVAL